MSKLLIDAGTTWSKILELFEDDIEIKNNKDIEIFKDASGKIIKGKISLLPSKKLLKSDLFFDNATGHMVKNHIKPDGVYKNEIIALAYGAKKLLNNPENATIIDLGSRDVKWVKFKDGKYCDLDWNGNCGSATGATVEMLCKFYDINSDTLIVQQEKIPVTCGVFAMEKIMDLIASDTPAEIAISRYIHGIAYNAWKFAGQPEELYLSGGFCLNKCFIKSLEKYCQVISMGRYVLLEGLY
jgi:activator of 2-hydroxyglutaryl-CoA dehydratase